MKFFALMMFLFLGMNSHAMCPIDPLEFNAVLTLIQNSSTCKEAVSLGRECSFENQTDTQIVDAAIAICKKDYTPLSAISAAAQADYDQLMKACAAKFGSSTLGSHVSARAQCQLRVADVYSMLSKTGSP